MKCQECSGENEVIALTTYWSCGGRNCFHFEWSKIEDDSLPLCQDCENDLFTICDHCGDFISNDCYSGMEEFDDDGELMGLRCPGCDKIMEG